MGAISRKLDKQNKFENEKARKALQKQGIMFVKTSPQDLLKWEDMTSQAMERLADEGVFSKSMLNILRKQVNDYRQQVSK